jgi:hypothetical protein
MSYEISGAFFNVRGRDSFFIATKTPSPSWVASLAQKAAPSFIWRCEEKIYLKSIERIEAPFDTRRIGRRETSRSRS